eukprot:m.23352 g.23352  ORF g.23352 m.23352 type:complete len:55 (+) comp14185_c0_seq1:1132-1296(+)
MVDQQLLHRINNDDMIGGIINRINNDNSIGGIINTHTAYCKPALSSSVGQYQPY